jgi:hypothetical protein
LVGIATFLVGSVLALVIVVDLEGELPNPDEVRLPEIETKDVPISALTFDGYGGIACGLDGRTPATWTSFRSSDGIVIASTTLRFRTDSSAQRELRKLSSSADRVLDSRPYTNYWNVRIGERLLTEKGSEFSLVTYTPVEASFNVNILTAKSLDHLLEFDKQRESLRRSYQVNRLKP